MKDMHYVSFSMRTVLASGEDNGYLWYVLSMGTHPTAYIKLPVYDDGFSIDDISCHGGITYVGSSLEIDNGARLDGFWIGWDYAHSGDFSGYFPHEGDKQWTTEEIVDEVEDVIKQLLILYGQPEKEDHPEESIDISDL